MLGLPEVVQSQILSSFCDGKSISTYFHVIMCNQSLREVAFDLLRDAMVDRFMNLAKEDCLVENNEEVKDVLDIIREEIRTCQVVQSRDGRLAVDDGDTSLREGPAKKISDYCAVIDYFDMMRLGGSGKHGKFILWCGELQTTEGRIERACLSSKVWSVTAMDYFLNELEMNNHSLTNPTPSSFSFAKDFGDPFGTLDIELENDQATLHRIVYNLSDDALSPRSILVPSQMEYEYTFGFTLYQRSLERRGLDCYWDLCDDGDFEYSLYRLAENAKRILNRMKKKL